MKTNSALMLPAQPPASNGAAAPLTFHDTVKPLIDIPNGWFWFFLALGALVLAAAAYLALRYWRDKRAAIKLPPPIPPHVRAYRTLEQALALIGRPEAFSVMVSGAIRLYLEERFDFHAPDRTTEEFLCELQSTQLLTQDQKKSLADFLASCDLIKFARYEPMEVELRALHASAVRLVNETEPRIVPDNIQSSVAPGGGGGGAAPQRPALPETPLGSEAQHPTFNIQRPIPKAFGKRPMQMPSIERSALNVECSAFGHVERGKPLVP